MTTYRDSGVDIASGDRASRIAAAHAAATFAGRKGRIGEPLEEEDGYAGFLDMGTYYLVQTDDSTGTKIDLAFDAGRFDTLGYDLLAMVADDAVCTGAEVLSVSNCLDIPKVDEKLVDRLLAGLSKACREQRIVIPSGEIAEVPGVVARGVWAATAVGIVEKEKVLKPETIAAGDAVIALRSAVARSNGFSLIRKILKDAFGEEWFNRPWKNGTSRPAMKSASAASGISWGEIFLTPSIVYHDAVLAVTGRYGEKRAVPVKALAHITGGGIPGKLRRILRKSRTGARLGNLFPPHDALRDLITLGNVPAEEAYRTWNMGQGMLAVTSPGDAERTVAILKKKGIEARIAGEITADRAIRITAYDGSALEFA